MVRIALVVVALLGALAAAWWVRSDDDVRGSGGGTFVPVRSGVLTVATEFPAPGFWEGPSVDRVTGGFEWAFAESLADQLGLDSVRVVDRPFDQLVQGDASGFDVALAQVSITRDRSRVVDLSMPYLTTPVGVVGRAGRADVPDLEAARGLSWAVARGTTEVDVVDDMVNPRSGVDVYPTTTGALRAVATGRSDVAAVDYIRALAEIDADPRLKLVGQINAPQYYGALLPKGSGNLDAVNSAIRALTADGTLGDLTQDLLDRYGSPSVPTIRVTP